MADLREGAGSGARRCPRWLLVVSDEYNSSSIYEPPDPGCDVMPVFTHSPRRAKVLAVRAWRRRRRGDLRFCESDENPFAHLTVDEP